MKLGGLLPAESWARWGVGGFLLLRLIPPFLLEAFQRGRLTFFFCLCPLSDMILKDSGFSASEGRSLRVLLAVCGRNGQAQRWP